MYAAIKAIEYHLPQDVLTNTMLAPLFPGRTPEELAEKTGVWERHVASPDQCSSDLGVTVAQKLFASSGYAPGDFDFLLFCTQTPDYFFPATACLVQKRLGIPTHTGAFDFNLGCSGYIYGLGLAKALVETRQAKRVLFITADTVCRYVNPADRATRILFVDAATATAIEACESDAQPELGPFVYGTDGGGADHLISYEGAFRHYAQLDKGGRNTTATCGPDVRPIVRMNGNKIVEFSLGTVPSLIREVLQRAQMSMADVDLFVFHQASKYILELLRTALKISEDKYYVSMSHSGNTVASTLPIALKQAACGGRLSPGDRVVLAGFGVGLSWGATVIRWNGLRDCNHTVE